MASTIKVDEIEGSTGSTVTVPTGQTFTVTDGIAIGSLPTITAVKGGTGQTGFAAGDILYANSTTTLTKLVKGSDDDVLTLASGIPSWAAAAGGGKINQMVSTQLDVSQTTSSTSYVAITGVTVSITPSATSSKIWVQGNLLWGVSTNNSMYMQMFRDSTIINEQDFAVQTDTFYGSGAGGDYQQLSPAPFSFLDEPSSTSSITYTVKWKLDGGTFYLNRIGGDTNKAGTSQFNLLEVLA